MVVVLGQSRQLARFLRGSHWDLAKGFYLSYHNKETILFIMDPYYSNLN